MEINILTIDDYIREQKAKGRKTITWNKKDVKVFRKFIRITNLDYRLPHDYPNGHMFMGIKHYKKIWR